MKKNTYKLYSLGCKVNQYDAGKLGSALSLGNLKETKENAEYAIVYTCSVTHSAVTKNRRMITKAKKENPKAKIILAGCWPRVSEIDSEKLGVDFILDTKDHSTLEEFILGTSHSYSHDSDLSQQTRSRYFIKVQDGCEQFCSYCIIPYTRGGLSSRKREDVLLEIKKAVQEGYREIVLSGIHLGLYGHDSEYKLIDLINDILEIKDLGRIRLSSIEINEVSDELIELIKKEKKICNHLHIPLQSGCDKILKLMNRPYRLEDFKNKVYDLRSKIPDIAITTDVIVGFPGEEDGDLLETYEFCQAMQFSKIHVFSFSAHERTPAYSMPGQVDVKVIKQRSKKLRDLSENLEKKYRDRFKKRSLECILEAIGNNKDRLKTEYYFDHVR